MGRAANTAISETTEQRERSHEPVIVPACNPSNACVNESTHHHEAPRTQNGFGRGQRWMQGIIRGLHRRHKGRNRFRVGVRGALQQAEDSRAGPPASPNGSGTAAVFCCSGLLAFIEPHYSFGDKIDSTAIASDFSKTALRVKHFFFGHASCWGEDRALVTNSKRFLLKTGLRFDKGHNCVFFFVHASCWGEDRA